MNPTANDGTPRVLTVRHDVLDSLRREPMTARDLRQDTGRSPSAINDTLRILLADGCVTAAPMTDAVATGDGRVPLVWTITEAGIAEHEGGVPPVRVAPPRKPARSPRQAPKAKPTSSASGAPESSQGVPEAVGPAVLREADVVAWVLADHRRAARLMAAMRDADRERAIIRALVEHVAATVVDLASELSEIPVRVIRAELERLHADGVVLCDGDWWSLAPVGRVA